ncbi:MAG: hypothetical protein BWY10_02660 [Chloroflexi bacterium ADurb.Bin180]|nr:MAG: hypothetical protein BWY10_02660 [Chloroflexi bacterium ADurb.Bin180]
MLEVNVKQRPHTRIAKRLVKPGAELLKTVGLRRHCLNGGARPLDDLFFGAGDGNGQAAVHVAHLGDFSTLLDQLVKRLRRLDVALDNRFYLVAVAVGDGFNNRQQAVGQVAFEAVLQVLYLRLQADKRGHVAVGRIANQRQFRLQAF